ncbi:hypothetical protein KXW29_008203 [Aspergillus fumigatus]|uniref:Uncharacterized protein n=2 Tax=Aspergillus fumigatus TaxID=746128 RepID=Q4WJK3_ASPFU|nr:hypothetical protein AFUA_1G05680 [Aspergillus fumigatus Af293]EAL88279.1 hypothetical protein AFUA_1G05680 [Aspergillus fumigatus Af293]KAH1899141.1 hypothetical protein KXV57_009180 [Aspergillus fumigatus]KAH2277691.1 hypothetical protein KXW02_007212 [Aspergillus fumigatus]KAH2723636.1 hypothetical protein KXW29_008203 [Aspergillus fumigatus]
MPTVLLPSSAAAFAPRSSPNVVLSAKLEPWLTATLKRVNRVKRPLNNVTQHTRCLTETLSSPNAIWTLCSMMFPKAPDSELRKDENPLVEAIFNYQMIHIEAYVVHVDMVSQNEVAFKLTPETIEALVEFHQDVYSVDAAASTWEWSEKRQQLKKLQEEFVQAANRFVYRTNVQALEGLEEDGAGELLGGRSDEAKAAIESLFVPLRPPPPLVVDVLRSTPILPSSVGMDTWWQPPMQQPASMETWKVLPSSPTTASTGDSNPNLWASLSGLDETHYPSSTSSYSQSFTTSPYDSGPYYNAAVTSAAMTALPLPSMLVQPCGTAASVSGFSWGGRYQDFALMTM